MTGAADSNHAAVNARVDQEQSTHSTEPAAETDPRPTKSFSEAEKAEPAAETESGITESDLLKAMTRNEYGLAKLYVKCFKNILLYDHALGEWCLWNKHRWMQDDREYSRAAYGMLLDAVIKIITVISKRVTQAIADGEKKPADAETEKNLRKFVRFSSTDRATSAVLKLARAGGDGLSTDGKQWNPDPWALGCENGVVDLKTGIKWPGDPKEMLNQTTGHIFPGIEAKSILWEDEVLPQIFLGDTEMIAFVQRLAGSSLVGGGIDSDDVWAICFGEAAAGKGVFLGSIQNALGDYAVSIPAQAFCKQKNPPSIAGPRSDILEWMHKRFGRGSEMDEKSILDDPKIKGIVSHELQTGRWPHTKREITFRPEMTLFLDTNYLPRTNAQDSGVWRRLLVVPFKAKFVDNPSRPNEF